MYSIMRATSFSVFNCKVFLPSLNKVIYLFIHLFTVSSLTSFISSWQMSPNTDATLYIAVTNL